MGRCKYLTPIYSALQDSGQHDLGVEWYNENLDFYHPVAISTEGRVLGLISDNDDEPTPVNASRRSDIMQ